MQCNCRQMNFYDGHDTSYRSCPQVLVGEWKLQFKSGAGPKIPFGGEVPIGWGSKKH